MSTSTSRTLILRASSNAGRVFSGAYADAPRWAMMRKLSGTVIGRFGTADGYPGIQTRVRR